MSCSDCCPPVIIGTGTGTPGPEGPAGPQGPEGPPGDGVCVSTDPGNALQLGTDGCMYVAEADAGAEGPPGPQGPEGPAGPPGEGVCISTDPENALQLGTDGCMYVAAAEAGAEGPPGPQGPEGPPGPAGEGACISTDPGNQLQEGTDGCLYVAEPTPPEPVLPVVQMTSQMLVYEADGAFDPAAYPGLQYVRVRAVGGGGGGVAVEAETPGTTTAVGIAGGGGSYAESLINATDLPAGPIAFTVGQGGAGVDAGVMAAAPGGHTVFGQPAGGSILDALVLAIGGGGGRTTDTDPSNPGGPGITGPLLTFRATTGSNNLEHPSGLLESKGHLTVPGGAGEVSWMLGSQILGAGNTIAVGGAGGGNPLSGRVASEIGTVRNGTGWAQGVSTVDGTIRYGAGGNARTSQFGGINDSTGYDGHAGVLVIEVVQLTVTAA